MEINSLMSAQLASLQQTLQLSLLDQTLTNSAAAVSKMVEDMPIQQAEASHPYKGLVVDLSV